MLGGVECGVGWFLDFFLNFLIYDGNPIILLFGVGL